MSSFTDTTTKSSNVVLVFDFDWSLINENSDTYIFKQLAPELLEKHVKASARERPGDWTNIIDQGLVKLQQDLKITVEQIGECVANIPVQEGMIESIRHVAAAGGKVHIVSDANEYFISVFLQKYGLQDLVTSIVTNKSSISPLLRIKGYHDGHDCELCPKNLCKGLVMKHLLQPDHAIVYVGDGGGDFCAGLKLRQNCDILLVRDDVSYPSARGLVKRIEREKNNHVVVAEIKYWKTGQEVLNVVKQVVEQRRSTL